MLVVRRMLILTRTKYGPRAYYVHWYCGYRWDTCGSTSPWGALLTFMNFLKDITEDQKKYFDFIEAWISVACTPEETK